MFLSACRGSVKSITEQSSSTENDPAVEQFGLQELNSLEEFKEIFNQDLGKARLVLLLSPT